MKMQLFSSGLLVCLWESEERRKGDGLLANPPKLFVMCYEEQNDDLRLRPVCWEIAGALAPDALASITATLRAAREARWQATVEAAKVANAA